jgi:hypothetical protein
MLHCSNALAFTVSSGSILTIEFYDSNQPHFRSIWCENHRNSCALAVNACQHFLAHTISSHVHRLKQELFHKNRAYKSMQLCSTKPPILALISAKYIIILQFPILFCRLFHFTSFSLIRLLDPVGSTLSTNVGALFGRNCGGPPQHAELALIRPCSCIQTGTNSTFYNCMKLKYIHTCCR